MRQRGMKPRAGSSAFVLAGLLLAAASSAPASDGWRTLTPPRPMPAPEASGRVEVNGARIFYALYGSANEEAVLLLHGGLGAGEDFGGQIPALANEYKVVAIDSRGHGRSTDDEQPYGYHLMASDVMGVMDHLGIAEAAVVGWSDGGSHRRDPHQAPRGADPGRTAPVDRQREPLRPLAAGGGGERGDPRLPPHRVTAGGALVVDRNTGKSERGEGAR